MAATTQIDAAPATAPLPAPVRKGPTLRWWLGACGLAFLTVVMSIVVGSHKRHRPTLDILDEAAHYGYVVALRDHHIPAWGDRLDQRTLRLAECVLFQDAGPGKSDCTRHPRDPQAFPAKGFSYEAQHPPLGYLPFAVTAKPNAEPRQALAAARRGGTLWTGIGALLLIAVGAVEGLSLLGLAVLLATCLLGPLHIYAAATVNNDAAAIAAGALALLVFGLSRRRRWRGAGVTGAAVGVTIGLLKGVFIVAPFVLTLAVLLSERPWNLPRAQWLSLVRRHAAVIGMLAGCIATVVAWNGIQGLRADTSATVVLDALLGWLHTDHVRLQSIFEGLELQTLLLAPLFINAPLHHLWNLSFFAVVVGCVILTRGRGERFELRVLAIAALCGLAVTAISWPVVNFFQGHWDGVAPQRYGLPLVPLMTVVFIRSLSRSALVALGIVLPVAALVWQLSVVKF